MTARRLAFATVVIALAGLAVWAVTRTRRVAVLAPHQMPITLAGTIGEPALSQLLVDRVEVSRHDGKRGEWLWEECVDRVGVLSLVIPKHADDDWRSDRINAWSTATGWAHGMYKEGGDALYASPTDKFYIKILELPSRADYHSPLERDLVLEHPDRLLVLGIAVDCPNPNPAWKDTARGFLSFIGVRR